MKRMKADFSPFIKIPGSIEAEQSVLGSMLIDSDIHPRLFASVKREDFTYRQNRALFTVARNMFRKGEPIDAVTLRGAASNEPDVMDNFDGKGVDVLSSYLVQLMEITPTSANWQEYAKIMREKSALYRAKQAAFRLYQNAETLDDCRQASEEIDAALNQRDVHQPYTLNQAMADFMDRLEQPPPEYLRYGIPELDRMMFTEPGDVVIIGGSPSSGKTALALSFAYELGKSRNVAFFSLETGRDKITDRLVTHTAQLRFTDVKTRALTANGGAGFEKEWERIWKNAVDYTKSRLAFFTDQSGPITLWDIENITRAYGYDAIFIDYVQNLLPTYRPGGYGGIRERITEISMELHTFAQANHVTIFELAQLSRQSKSAGWAEPTMFDLKESGQLEQDADAVLLIYRPPKGHKIYDEETNRFLKVAKNKEGKTGCLILDFDGETQTFSVRKSDGNGKEIMRELNAAGRSAKQSNRVNAYYENQPSMFDDDDNSDLPF